MFRCSLVAFSLIFGLATAGAAQQSKTPPSRPNVLLIIGDNWAWPFASIHGDKVVKTPTFDKIAREGALLTHAFAPFPSCAPSRAALLSGKVSHRLAEGANLWGTFPDRFEVFPHMLSRHGYFVGFAGKGWGPGSVAESGRELNPAGKEFKDFKEFLEALPADRPFCFWHGSRLSHFRWDQGQEHKKLMKAGDVVVPPYLPDHATVRDDILDYCCEVQELDREAAAIVELLHARGQLDNTLIVMTSDNGWQMPRGLANVYDAGTRIPMAVRWGAQIRPGRRIDAMVSLTDLAPTFLEAAGVKTPPGMDSRSILPLLRGEAPTDRDHVFLERERHANVRKGDLTYPIRALRTRDHLYIRNLEPDRWPAGDPQLHFAVGPFGDVDGTPTKMLMLQSPDSKLFQLAFGKRPAEELYDLRKDPNQMHNLAGDATHAATLRELRERVTAWMKATDDPRAQGPTDFWDKAKYFGPPAKSKR